MRRLKVPDSALTLDRVRSFFRAFGYYIGKLWHKFYADHIWVLSSGIAFKLLFSFIPFMLIMFTLVGVYLDSKTSAREIVNFLFDTLPFQPDYKSKMIVEIGRRTEELRSFTVVSGWLGGIGLIWITSGLFSAIRDVLCRVYRIKDTLNLFKEKLRDFVLIFLVLVLFILTTGITSIFRILENYSQSLLGFEISIGFLGNVVQYFFTFSLTFAMFYLAYAFIPHWKTPRKVLLMSTSVASVFFEILKFLFTFYILEYADYRKLYGTYASIAITFFWIYYISAVFVIGAEIGEIFREKHGLHVPMENGNHAVKT